MTNFEIVRNSVIVTPCIDCRKAYVCKALTEEGFRSICDLIAEEIGLEREE